MCVTQQVYERDGGEQHRGAKEVALGQTDQQGEWDLKKFKTKYGHPK